MGFSLFAIVFTAGCVSAASPALETFRTNFRPAYFSWLTFSISYQSARDRSSEFHLRCPSTNEPLVSSFLFDIFLPTAGLFFLEVSNISD